MPELDITGEVVLPADVVLERIDSLPAKARERLDYQPGDYSLTRPRSRTPSSIVDGRTAGLLEILRRPKTIVDAVITYSRAERLDPRETLEKAFPILQRFLDTGLLLAAQSQLAQPIATSCRPGQIIGPLEIVEPVYLIIDTEVYLARAKDGAFAALKIARPGVESKLRSSLAHEAMMLNRLDGRVNPAVIDQGEVDGRPYLAVSWCGGVDASEAAEEARVRGSQGRPDLLRIVRAIVQAYAHIHAQGILHGDVHPRNVVVDHRAAVNLIDFGFAAPIDLAEASLCRSGRGCIDLFMEPELARANLAGLPAPAATALGEQYSVAALIYLLLTGAHTHDFVLEDRQMQQQLAEEPPRAFDHRGVYDLPNLERVVRQALAKAPESRFATMSEFLRQVADASEADQRASSPHSAAPQNGLSEAHSLLQETLERLAISGPLLASPIEAPTSSMAHGAAGFAYALLRIACIRGDAKLLALADLWSNRASRELTSSPEEAFWNRTLGISKETTGNRSLHHTGSGIHCVDALVARARGDELAERRALEAFLSASRAASSHLDVCFGHAGIILGCAVLLETTSTALVRETAGLRTLGDELVSELWKELEAAGPIGNPATQRTSLGVAHGLAGMLYAILRWTEISGTPLPAKIEDRLMELAALATPIARGLRWPSVAGGGQHGPSSQASWCNGAAGFVYLWTLSDRLLGTQRHEPYATGAAWTAFESPHASGDLCCGLAGRSYALLNLYKQSGDRVWLQRARQLGECAAATIRTRPGGRESLYQGRVGVALLAAELENPQEGGMPLFER